MSERPNVLSIAGFDPSAGAGLLADVKTLEQHRVYGLGVCTANTIQTDRDFTSVNWISEQDILGQLQAILNRFKIVACKIGIVPSLALLPKLAALLKEHNEHMFIVADPVLSATTGFEFHRIGSDDLKDCFKNISLITPNYNELEILKQHVSFNELLWETNVLLKGGHNPGNTGTDMLYYEGKEYEIEAMANNVSAKHGSGCILSAAIAANMANKYSLPEACRRAKEYTEKKLNSNTSLLAYHYI